jgi:hypothetical protein
MRWSKRKTLLTVILLAIVAGTLAVLLMPRSFVNERARLAVAAYLHRRLGPEAAVERVDVGWGSIRFSGVSLPLGKGSHLEIDQATANINVLQAAISPSRPERSLRRITCQRPQLFLTMSRDTGKTDTTETILPTLTMPAGLYSALGRLDSLCQVSFRDADIHIIEPGDTLTIVSNLRGTVFHDAAWSIRLKAQGAFLKQQPGTVQLTAVANTDKQRLGAVMQLSFRDQQIASLLALPDSFQIRGGKGLARLRFMADSLTARISGDADVADLHVEIPGYGGADLSRSQLSLCGDTLLLSHFEGVSRECTVRASGQVVLRHRSAWNITGEMRSLKGENFADILFGNPASAAGELHATLAIHGPLLEPEIDAELTGDTLRLGPLTLRKLRATASLSRSAIRLEQLAAHTVVGDLSMTGEVAAHGRDFPLSATGSLRLTSNHEPLGFHQVSDVTIDLSGTLRDPSAFLTFSDNSGNSLVAGSIQLEDGTWRFVTREGVAGPPLRVDVAASGTEIMAKVRHAEQLRAVLAPSAWRDGLEYLRDVSVDFKGQDLSGSFTLNAAPDTANRLPGAFSQIRRVTVRGSYVHPRQGPLALLGGWEVEATKDFAGTFDLALSPDTVEFHEVRIADFATLTGTFWPEHSQADLDLEIHGVPLDLLPVRLPVLERARVRGIVTGHARASGSMEALTWTADLSLVSGEAFDVKGYWSTIVLTGLGARCDVTHFVFGRDIGRIFSATGHVDLQADSVELVASSGERIADEVLRGVTGHGGWLDGMLDARAVISGRLSAPSVRTVISVSHGHLLKDISFDTLTAVVAWDFDDEGQREIRVSNARMERFGRYYLTGHLVTNPSPGGRLAGAVTGHGQFLCIVDELAGSFHTRKGRGSLEARLGGTWDHPRFLGAELSQVDGEFTFTDLTPDVITVDLTVRLSPSGVLEHGRVDLRAGSRRLTVRTITDPSREGLANLRPILVESPALDLGIIEIASGSDGMPMRFPGMMAADWVGDFTFGLPDGRSLTLSQEDDHLLIQGDVAIRDATITYPFIEGSGRTTKFTRWLLRQLKRARWDLRIVPEEGNHYYAEFTGLKDSEIFADWRDSPLWRNFADLVDRLEVDAQINPTERGVLLEGTIQEKSFHGVGRVTSTRGRVDYLDQTFRVDEVVAEFDASDPRPVMRGRAETTGQDSLGRRVPVYLTLYAIDRETGIRAKEGRLDELSVVLEGEVESSPEEVLALLGYSIDDVGNQAWRMGQAIVERAFRSWLLRPVERRLGRWTGLDVLSVTPTLRSRHASRRTGNGAANDTLAESSGARYFTGSQLTVGKFLTHDLFFSYTGELAEGEEVGLEGKRLGFVHLWTMEYRMRPISRDLVVDFSVEYDNLERRRDESVSLKYTFALQP